MQKANSPRRGSLMGLCFPRDQKSANPNREAIRKRRRRDAMRIKVTLRCNDCKQRNYDTTKNKKNTPDRLELNKYCRFCRKHTVHSETK